MLLSTEQLTKAYGSFVALDRLDLAVGPGEVVGLLGPNGSGKSTALRLMLGFLQPTANMQHTTNDRILIEPGYQAAVGRSGAFGLAMGGNRVVA